MKERLSNDCGTTEEGTTHVQWEQQKGGSNGKKRKHTAAVITDIFPKLIADIKA